MELDLKLEKLSEQDVAAREYDSIDNVINVPDSVEELVVILNALSLPESLVEDMDYKDYRTYKCNLWLEIIVAIPNTEITSFSDGGKYGHVYFTYNGEIGKLGYIETNKG